MSKHRWKDVYYRYDGVAVKLIDYTYTGNNDIINCVSSLGTKNGTGSPDNPCSTYISRNIQQTILLADGYHDLSGMIRNLPNYIGQSKETTSLFISAMYTGHPSLYEINFKGFLSYYSSSDTRVRNCIIDMDERNTMPYLCDVYNCIIRNKYMYIKSGCSQNVYQQLDLIEVTNVNKVLSSNLNLFENCNIVIDSASQLNNYRNNYQGFINCRFRIGAEESYKSLVGTTESELRNDFKARCEAQGFSVPNVSDYNENLPMGRWVFANDGVADGYILRGSIIEKFQTRRFIFLGNSGKVVDTLPITTAANTPFSFNTKSPKGNKILLSEDSISLDNSIDLSQISENTIESSVGLLPSGGLAKLTVLDVVDNLNAAQGVRVAGDKAFGDQVIGVQPNVNYLVRSNDNAEAIVVYNGVTYSSSLSNRNNVFRGVEGKITFEPSGNAVVYPVTDLSQQQVVDIRIVRELPPGEIRSGNLLSGFWYFVASGDADNPVGTIRYKGVDYPFGSSFLVEAGDLTFKIGTETGNNLHLRRCWADNYDPNDTGYIDYNFWKGKQQPRWTKVIMSDLRCLMERDTQSSDVIKRGSDGEYLTSGHPEFYSYCMNLSGFPRPIYPIVGKFMQMRLCISTYNAV